MHGEDALVKTHGEDALVKTHGEDASALHACASALTHDIVIEIARILSACSCHSLLLCLHCLQTLHHFHLLSTDTLSSLLQTSLSQRFSSLHAFLAAQKDLFAVNLALVASFLVILRKYRSFFATDSLPPKSKFQRDPFQLNPQMEIIDVFVTRPDSAVVNSSRSEDVEGMGVYVVQSTSESVFSSLLHHSITSAVFVRSRSFFDP